MGIIIEKRGDKGRGKEKGKHLGKGISKKGKSTYFNKHLKRNTGKVPVQ